MTGTSSPWTRRQFTQALATSLAISRLGRKAAASTTPDLAGFAFVASTGASTSAPDGAIHAFRVSGSKWSAVQTVPAHAPAHLESHPTLPILYAVHAVGLWNNLPRGAVSAYSISPTTGQLTLHSTQPLSLSATHPRHAAVTPDGRHLFVAAERGAVYNLLPIAADGSLESPIAIRKEFGLLKGTTPKVATPLHVVFHPGTSTVLTADPGQETINSFALGRESIDLRHRTHTHPGAGPSQLVLSPSGEWAYALHTTDGSIAAHRIDAGRPLPASQIHTARQPGPALMAMHPSGRFLITTGTDGITCLAIDPRSGQLSPRGPVLPRPPLRVLAFSPCGHHLLGAVPSSGHLLRVPFDAASGTIGRPQTVAHVNAASSLLFRPA